MKSIVKKAVVVVIIFIVAGCYSYGHWGQSLYVQTAESGDNKVTNPITGDMEIRQSFVSRYNGMDELKIKLLRSGSDTVPDYSWSLLDENGQELQSGTIGEEELAQKTFVKKKTLSIPINEQKNSAGKTYTFVLKANGATQNGYLAAYYSDPNKWAQELSVEGEGVEGALVLKVIAKRFNVETFLVFLGLVVYVGFFIKFMYKLFR